MNENILLSICVPTYNRGRIALSLINELVPIAIHYGGLIEIVISNNGSDRFTEEYDTISQIKSDYLTYSNFDKNEGFVHNFNQVIRLSKGKFCLLLSDEDHLVKNNIDIYIEYLLNNPTIGIVRGATDRMYSYQKQDERFNAGKSAVDGYFLQGNYISGVIYNRSILTNELIDSFEKKYSSNEAYIVYPHMFLEAFICLKADIYKSKSVLIREGESQNDHEKDASIPILPYSTIESRLTQTKGYLELINDIDCTNGIKLKMISDVVNKTYQLLFFQYKKYEAIGINCYDLMNQVMLQLKGIFAESDIPVIKRAISILMEYAEAVKDSYIREYESIVKAKEIDLSIMLDSLIESYQVGSINTQLLMELVNVIKTEDSRDTRSYVRERIMDSLYSGISANSKYYSYIVMYSFLIWLEPSEDTLVPFLDEIERDQSLTYKNLYYIYYQVSRIVFMHPECNTTEINFKKWKLLNRALDVCIREETIDLSPIDFDELNENISVVITTQFLGANHGPTKTALDRAVVLKKRMGKSLIINTEECLTEAGKIPFLFAQVANHSKMDIGHHNISWKDNVVDYYQCEKNIMDSNSFNQLINSVRELKPKVCVCVGGASLIAGILSRIIPTICIGLTQSNLAASLCSFQVADRHQIELDKALIKKLDYANHIIEGKFTFDVLNPSRELSREHWGIPDDAFVLSIVGGRLPQEITDELWSALNEVNSEKLFVITIGPYEIPDGFDKRFSNLSGKVLTMGFCNDAVSMIGLSNLYINPHRKGGATSAVEAMMQKIPVVTTNYGDVAGVTEKIFWCNNYCEYPKRIERYINDSDFYNEHQKVAKTIASVLLDSDAEFNRIIDVFLDKAKAIWISK